MEYMSGGKLRTRTIEGPYHLRLSWPEFINIIAPLMLLGMAYIRPRKGNEYNIAIVLSVWR